MAQIGIFFGSDTGNTENVAKLIQQQLKEYTINIYDISQATKSDIEKYKILFFGISTWYYGEAQCDWEDFFPTLKTIDFGNKCVALFGCGDQEDYAEYFCDAMGTLRNILISCKATMIGSWPVKGYCFKASKALISDTHFAGLVVDEDRQPQLTLERIKAWSKQIRLEIG